MSGLAAIRPISLSELPMVRWKAKSRQLPSATGQNGYRVILDPHANATEALSTAWAAQIGPLGVSKQIRAGYKTIAELLHDTREVFRFLESDEINAGWRPRFTMVVDAEEHVASLALTYVQEPDPHIGHTNPQQIVCAIPSPAHYEAMKSEPAGTGLGLELANALTRNGGSALYRRMKGNAGMDPLFLNANMTASKSHTHFPVIKVLSPTPNHFTIEEKLPLYHVAGSLQTAA